MMTATTKPPRGRLGIRARATANFGLIGLLVAVVVAGLTYGVARRYLVEQREDVATRQAYVNARLARSVLRGENPDVRAFLAGLGGGTASSAVVRYRDEWFSTSVTAGREAVPADLARVVGEGRAGHQRYRDADGRLHVAVGVAVPAVDAAYFELFPLTELERTLGVLRRALTLGAAAAAVTAALVGYGAARRLVRPLQPVAAAAERIAAGDLATRLDPEGDPDLKRLVDAFNAMAASLDERIQREARFAADVSHEVRAPLAALAAAVEVIERRRAHLPEQVLAAFEILGEKVQGFQQMVLDLLEISRIDAGTVALAIDRLDLRSFLTQLAEMHGHGDVAIDFADGAPRDVFADRRRLAQALGNIIDNAGAYGNGVRGITVAPAANGHLRIVVDDNGPGVPPEEREAIFGRFARGEVGLQSGSSTGSGLGLALVVEHLRLHKGRVWVEDAPGGGGRFVVELPEDPR
ncbi:MAG TPA: HAMP domain-containing sensor histidine kinase [Acidimicrobiales bacterium]